MTIPAQQFTEVRLDKLHPTQITVGKLEVALKRRQWSEMSKKARLQALTSHWFPAVLGPEDRYFIVDHHHFGLALLEEGVKTASIMLLKDLSWLDPSKFWGAMDHHRWVHPFDRNGLRREYADVPVHLTHLHDDPYRSLAGELRRCGGYAKDATPFSEFLWADFFRPLIAPDLIEHDFGKALAKAKKLARTQQARYLPGWCGVVESV